MAETRTFIRDVEVHPAALLFPELESGELSELSKDISEHGVRVPLVFCDGKLLDGRNRLRACVMAGIPTDKIPRRNVDGGSDPYVYSWSLNAERRHLTPSQRAAIRLKVMEASGELESVRIQAKENMKCGPKRIQTQKKVRVAETLAKAAGVSVGTATTVITTRKRDPEKFDRLTRGEGDERGGTSENRGTLPRGHPLLAKRRQPKNWNVPRAIPAMAAFLRERLPSDERMDLARRLTSGEP
jgi:hypothetical protein